MSKMIKMVLVVIVCALVIAVPSVWANWVVDGAALCTAAGSQWYPQITSDGAGGAIVAWIDNRGEKSQIYAQRVNASGAVQWTTDGVVLGPTTGTQGSPAITSDSAGGAIVTWDDNRNTSNFDIYAQRVNASGAAQWAADGAAICTATGNQYTPTIVFDGAGGAIVTWRDDYNTSNWDIYAQRVNASGIAQWVADGVALCTATGNQYTPTIVSDGAGGAIVTWYDYHGGKAIYAQRVDASGAVQWTADGVALCTAAGSQEYSRITSDGAGGAIVAWMDNRSGSGWHIYAQSVNASGAVQWTSDGVALCTAAGSQWYPQITSDGAGGAIVAWINNRSDKSQIYAQRVNASGAVQWTTDGVALCTAEGSQGYSQITSDGAGGAIVAWMDNRSESGWHIYAQSVNASGAVQWTSDGVALCTAEGSQGYFQITSDGAGGAIVTWEDPRNGGGSPDIYAQRVDSNGSAPPNGPRPPKTPQGLTGRPFYYNNSIIALFITWNRNAEPNISYYQVYRDSIEDFVPGVGNLLASPNDTVLVDVQWRWFPHRYYKVAAIDSNGLRSGFALLRPDDVTGTDTPNTPEMTYLAQNYPNPFNPMTRMVFGLSAPGPVSLRIYDAAGRLVRVLADAARPAGVFTEIWDGRDSSGHAVASGIYFYRLDAGTFTQTRKMVLLR